MKKEKWQKIFRMDWLSMEDSIDNIGDSKKEVSCFCTKTDVYAGKSFKIPTNEYKRMCWCRNIDPDDSIFIE
jgi:hypothetical protein